MGREFLLALDLGTTGVRALVVALDGRVRARAYRRLVTSFPAPGLVEQDPRHLLEQSLDVLREALATARLEARDVAGLGVATQRATALAWDASSGEPLGPALGWQDQRSAALAARFRDRGLSLAAQMSASKWRWWLEESPQVRAAARTGVLRFGTPDAWLAYQLSSDRVHVTDPGQASCTSLYDLGAGGWSKALLEPLGIEPAWLPRIVATGGVVGETEPKRLGDAVALAARAGDQQAAAFAQGVHQEGECKLTLGTAAMLDRHVGAAPRAPEPGTLPMALWRLPDGGDAFCLEGCILTAGAVLDWAVRIGLLDAASDADRLAASVASSEGVAFVPALQGLGTPFFDESARGLLGGLTRGSQRAHVVRALLQGIAQRCVDVCDVLLPAHGPLRVDGGLARSRLLLQWLADLSGREVWCARERETTGLGAALLAGLGAGLLASPSDCAALALPPERIAPRTADAERAAWRTRWRTILERARG